MNRVDAIVHNKFAREQYIRMRQAAERNQVSVHVCCRGELWMTTVEGNCSYLDVYVADCLGVCSDLRQVSIVPNFGEDS